METDKFSMNSTACFRISCTTPIRRFLRLKVLEVITGGEAGGAQRHVRDLCRGLKAWGHDVQVVHGGGDWIARQPGITAQFLPALVRDPHPAKDGAAYFRLKEICRRESPDVVHAHSSKAGVLARMAAWSLHIPAVYTAHGFVFADPTRSRAWRAAYRLAEQWCGRRSAQVIAVSARDQALGQKLGIPHIIHVPNGVLPIVERPLMRVPSPLRVGFLGRFQREKGFEILVEAIKLLARPVVLVVAGNGPEAERFERWATMAHLDVTFLGWQDESLALFRQVDVLAIPSWKEGLPYTLLDALAYGLPTVVTDVGGMGEVVGQLDPRLVVPPGNPAQLAQGLSAAASLAPDFTDRAKALIAASYSLDGMIRRTVSILESAARTAHA